MRYYCTLYDVNYLPKGLALYDSLVRHAQPFHLYILPMDDETFWLLDNIDLEHTTILPLPVVERRLGLAHVRQSRAWIEYCWTMASQLMQYVMSWIAPPVLTYLDSDLFLFSSPEPIYDELGGGSIAIVPHRFHRGNARLLVNGVYNVGWLTINNDPTGLACLNHWAAQVREWCYHRNEPGKFGDQGYLDSWPYDYGPACVVINHIGAGLAPWNVIRYGVKSHDGASVYVSRTLSSEDTRRLDESSVNSPLIFYHFHEFTHDLAGNPTRLTRHPHTADHKRLIYAPYIAAIKNAVSQVYRVQGARQARQEQSKQESERA